MALSEMLRESIEGKSPLTTPFTRLAIWAISRGDGVGDVKVNQITERQKLHMRTQLKKEKGERRHFLRLRQRYLGNQTEKEVIK